jgi:hypothetical protein
VPGRNPLPVPAALAVALAALLGLPLLPAALDLLSFHPGEVIVLPRLPAFAGLAGRLILPFLALLPAPITPSLSRGGVLVSLPGRAALLVLLAVLAARLAFAIALLRHGLISFAPVMRSQRGGGGMVSLHNRS